MNSLICSGRIASDIDIKYTSSGKCRASFSFAVPRPFSKDITDFFRCIAWDKTAELIGNHLTKGNRALLSGIGTLHAFEGKDGNKITMFEFIVNNVEFLDKKDNNSSNKQSSSQQGFEGFGNAEPFSEEIPF